MQLEWVESGVLDTVARALAHQPIYARPSHVFVPYLYTPLYYYAGAFVCRLTGLGFTPLRLLSSACTAGCFALLFQQTRSLTADWRAGLLATGCFAGFYAAAGGCFDLARVDMLYLLFVLAGAYAIWHEKPFLAGLLFACAYQSKQGGAIIAVCALASSWRRPQQCVTGMVTFFVAAGASAFWMNNTSGGWYAFYTQWLPAHQPLDVRSLFSFVARDLGRYLLPALLIIGWTARWDLAQLWRSRRGTFLCFVAAGTFLTALSGRLHSGGAANATLPLYAWTALLFGVALHRCFAANGEQPLQERATTLLALAALQFVVMFYAPSRYLPSQQARQQAQQFLAQMAAVPGDIFVVGGAADLEPAHKNSFANGVTVWDVVRAGDSAARRELEADIRQSIEQRTYKALLAPSPLNGSYSFPGEPPDLARYYQLDEPPLRTGTAARALEVRQNPGVAPLYLYPVR